MSPSYAVELEDLKLKVLLIAFTAITSPLVKPGSIDPVRTTVSGASVPEISLHAFQ